MVTTDEGGAAPVEAMDEESEEAADAGGEQAGEGMGIGEDGAGNAGMFGPPNGAEVEGENAAKGDR